MSTSNSDSIHNLVLVTASDGISLIQTGTPLARLNYFDGKFLRAADLQAEQRYLRELVKAGNRAAGSGVVHGLELRLADDDEIVVSPGLAIDGSGQAILVPAERTLSVAALIEASRGLRAADAGTVTGETAGCFESCAEPATEETTAAPASTWYLITVAYAEALCGEEDVYGALCEQACVTTTDRPLRVEGALLRARPLIIDSELATSGMLTLRSSLASAYFADEAARHGCPISAATLHSGVWCAGAVAGSGSEVPLGVLVREGSVSRFLDLWTARREHIDSPPKRYWQWCMGMRPWNVFLAQVLQFQCQLRDVLAGQPIGGGSVGPCGEAQSLVGEAASQLGAVSAFYRALITGVGGLSAEALAKLLSAMQSQGLSTSPEALAALQQRLESADAAYRNLPANGQLVHLGIVELPSAGYLPVSPSDTLSVNEQVRRLLGDGVALSFCTCRPDYVAHALEEAQHLERIPLLEGLGHPERRPQVDILVPNGEILQRQARAEGPFFEVEAIEIPAAEETGEGGTTLRGVARGEALPGGGGALYLAGVEDAAISGMLPRNRLRDWSDIDRADMATHTERDESSPARPAAAASMSVSEPDAAPRLRLWLEASCDANPFELPVGGVAVVKIGLVYGVTRAGNPFVWALDVSGKLQVKIRDSQSGADALECAFIGDLQLSKLDDGHFVPVEQQGLTAKPVLTLSLTDSGGWHLSVRANISPDAAAEGGKSILTSALEGAVAWSGTPINAAGSYKGISITPDRTFSAKEDAALADTTDERSRLAVDAILSLGRAAAGNELADMALAQLFPPSPSPSGSLLVRAVRDWVLFHRRRERACAKEVPAPAPTRTFVVYRLAVATKEELETIAETLKNNGDLSGFEPERVASLVFLAGLPILAGSGQDVPASWPPDEHLLGVVLANASNAARKEGKSIAKGRLERIVDLVPSAVGATATAPKKEVRNRVPTGLDPEGGDGVVLLLAMRVVEETACHLVYWLRPWRDKDLDDLLGLGAIESLLGSENGYMRLLGRVSYRGQSAEMLQDGDAQEVKEKWSEHALDCPAAGVLTFRPEGAGPAGDEVAKARSAAILDLLGSTADAPSQVRQATEALSGDCVAVSLIGPLSACIQVHRLQALSEEQVKEIDRAIEQKEIAKLIRWTEITTRLGEAHFCPESDESFVNKISALEGEDRVRGIWYAIQPGEDWLTEGQAEGLVKGEVIPKLGEAGRGAGTPNLIPVDEGGEWSSNCPLLVFVVIRFSD